MAELHSNVYYKHHDSEVMDKLDLLFYESEEDEQTIIHIAQSLNPNNGTELAQGLINLVDEPKHDLDAESIEKVDGYSIAHFVHGSMGDEIVGSVVSFLNQLIPDIQAQAWGCGDDDPWEFWFKYENGKVIRKDDEPLMDEEEDEEIKNTIYKWWHSDMPSSIEEGFLNDDDE